MLNCENWGDNEISIESSGESSFRRLRLGEDIKESADLRQSKNASCFRLMAVFLYVCGEI